MNQLYALLAKFVEIKSVSDLIFVVTQAIAARTIKYRPRIDAALKIRLSKLIVLLVVMALIGVGVVWAWGTSRNVGPQPPTARTGQLNAGEKWVDRRAEAGLPPAPFPLQIVNENGQSSVIERVGAVYFVKAYAGENYSLALVNPGGAMKKYVLFIDGFNIINKMDITRRNSARRGFLVTSTLCPLDGWYLSDGSIEGFQFIPAPNHSDAVGARHGQITLREYAPTDIDKAALRGVATAATPTDKTHSIFEALIGNEEKPLREFIVYYGSVKGPHSME